MNIKSKLSYILIAASLLFWSITPLCTFAAGADSLKSVQNKISQTKRHEIKILLKKFGVSMSWVAGSCVVIFLMLLSYKRLKNSQQKIVINQDISKNLNSPETLDEATKFFIEKF